MTNADISLILTCDVTYFDIKFGTILATAHSITDRFGPKVWYYPEDNVIKSKIFLRLDLIENVSMLNLFFNKSPVTRVLNSYKILIIRA